MMAPESERANTDKVKVEERWYRDGRVEQKIGNGEWEMIRWPQNVPFVSVAEPTLTCSKVVERLAKIVMDAPINYPDKGDGGGVLHPHTVRSNIAAKLRTQAPAILHSWRERRVQELEECLRESDSYLSLLRHRAHVPWGAVGLPTEYEVDKVTGKTRRLLANSEQIRKGAKHEPDL